MWCMAIVARVSIGASGLVVLGAKKVSLHPYRGMARQKLTPKKNEFQTRATIEVALFV